MNKSIDQRIEEERKQARRSWQGILLILALIPISIGLIAFFMNWGMGNQEPNFLYRQTESGWQPIDGLPGSPQQIEISPAGIVWVKTSFSSGLSRFDGTTWQHFNGDDFGTRQNYVHFALVGEEVWAANPGGVFHFADGYWTTIPQSPRNDHIGAVAASRDSFWMIDREHQLSYFDGSQWTSHDLSTFLPNREWFFNIMLLATPAESLWLNKEGRLWHFNGQAWQEFFLEDQADASIRLLNQTSEAFWVQAGGMLTALTFAGKEKQPYDIREMGLTTEVAIGQVAMHKGSLWVATNEGLLTFDGQQWQQLAPPSPELSLFRDVTLAPDGTLWTINDKSAETMGQILWDIVSFLLISVVAIVLALAGWKLNMRWFTSSIEASHKQEVERSKEVSSRFLPDMPVEEKQYMPAEEEPVAKIKLLDFIPYLLLSLVLYWFLPRPIEDALERVWPDAPFAISQLIVSSILISIMLLIIWGSQKWHLGQKEEGESLSWKQGLFLMAGFWLSIFLMIFSFGGLSWLIKNYNLPGWIVFFPIFFVPVFLSLLTSPSLLLQWWIWRAAQKADYEQAFRRLRFYERFTDNTNKESDLLTLEGKLLFFVGRYEEALELFDQLLRDKHNRTNKFDSDMLNDLSTALLELGRYEEAIDALESSIIMKASQVVAYNCLAEVYLYQGTNLKEARKLTERGLQNHDASLFLRVLGKEEQCESFAIHAWVLAELGLHDDAAQALERAFAVAPRNHKPLLAALHLRAGYVSLLRGDHHQAREHFTTGQQLDPKGHYGRLAGSALAKM